MNDRPVAYIYAILNPDGARCYVGSTLGSLARRLVRHRSRARTNERPHSRLHNFMLERDPANFTIEHIATVPIPERFATEARLIREHGTLNYVIPGRTRAQRRAEARAARAALPALPALPAPAPAAAAD